MEAAVQQERKTRMMTVRLLRHYVPIGEHEVVGHQRDSIMGKDAGGREVELRGAQYVKGEGHPAPFPGVGFANKIWANTDIRVPVEEAKALVNRGVAVRSLED